MNLPVKHFSQLDSDTDEAMRMCFSSSVAMLVHYLTKAPIPGPHAQSDDNWLEKNVHAFGDSTDAQAQVRALSRYGVKARYTQQAGLFTLVTQLELGFPVPVGTLHKGHVSNPTGGGHWMLVRGMSADAIAAIKASAKGRLPGFVYVNDPAGELDLANGGYHISNEGSNRAYSLENFARRWLCGPIPGVYQYTPGTGWAILASK